MPDATHQALCYVSFPYDDNIALKASMNSSNSFSVMIRGGSIRKTDFLLQTIYPLSINSPKISFPTRSLTRSTANINPLPRTSRIFLLSTRDLSLGKNLDPFSSVFEIKSSSCIAWMTYLTIAAPNGSLLILLFL